VVTTYSSKKVVSEEFTSDHDSETMQNGATAAATGLNFKLSRENSKEAREPLFEEDEHD
jgi:hypothetical protein